MLTTAVMLNIFVEMEKYEIKKNSFYFNVIFLLM